MSNESSNPQKTLWELIKDIKFGMLTTRHTNGVLHSRPMTLENKDVDESSTLYFFASKTGELSNDIATDHTVGVTFSDTGKDSYVGISGTAKYIEDEAKKKELFTAAAKAYFPKGVDDPDLGLIAITIEKAEYWDVKENKATQLIKMAASALTGKPPEMGEHREVRLH